MRCFYCSRVGMPASEEHIPSKFLGSRLKTRRVCVDCNNRAAAEIDNHFASFRMVLIRKALADVRSINHQQTPPSIETDAVVSATGERVQVTFSPSGREVRRANGQRVRGTVEVAYVLGDDLWMRFAAKVALGCAAKLPLDDEWLDSRLARALQSLLWDGSIDNAIWPTGVP